MTALDVEELRRLRAVVDASPLGVVYADAAWQITYVNRRCEEISGRSAQELIGTVIDELWMVDDAQAARADGARAELSEHDTWSSTTRMWRPDGEIRHIRIWVSHIGTRSDSTFVGVFEDVTDRMLAEGDAERAKALVNGSLDIMCILDERFNLEYVNPIGRERLGIPAHVRRFAGIDPTVVLRFDAETLRTYEDDAVPALLKNGRWGGNASYINRDGEPVFTTLDITRHVAVDGTPFYTLKAHDITEHVLLAERLAQSEAWFRTLVHSSAEAVFVADPTNGITFANEAASTLLGIPPDEIVGTRLRSYIHPDDFDAQPDWVRYQNRLSDEGNASLVHIVRPDGGDRWCEVSAVPVVSSEFEQASLVTVRDVTERRALEAAVIAEGRRFTAVVENLSDAITIVSPSGTVMYRSDRAMELFGSVSPFAGLDADPLGQVHPDDLGRVVEVFRSMVERPEHGAVEERRLEFRVVAANGAWMHCESRWTDLRHDPAIGGVVIQTRDVTDRRRSEQLVRDQAEFLRLVASGEPLAHSLDTMCELVEQYLPDVKASMMLVEHGTLNFIAGSSIPSEVVRTMRRIPVSADAAACGRAAAIGKQVRTADVTAEPGLAAMAPAMATAGMRSMLSTPVVNRDTGEVTATIGVYWPEVHEPTAEELDLVETLKALAAIAIDRHSAEARLAHQALHDALTGLPNRALFTEVLKTALARTSRRGRVDAVLFIDLDRFKHVNDSLGHDAGDELLVTIAARLHAVARVGDTISRFGGDEFTVLCEDLEPSDAPRIVEEVAQRLLDAIAVPVEIGGRAIRVSGSVGIAIGGPNASAGALIRDADIAMYRAKERGKARWEIFDEDLLAVTRHRIETEFALNVALDRREFLLEYQPIVNLATDRVEGLEALVRWRHPERGIVPPGDFIELAEETGLIGEIGEFVLTEACRQVGAWVADGTVDADFSVSVNLSVRQFEHGDIIATVGAAIDAAGIAPGQLCIEITEGTLMADGLAEVLQGLHAIGVRVAIDDFGTGYSSLYYLKRFPVDVVKIDRSFVDGLGTDADDEAIVAAVLSLGHALGLRVVAEGIETESQRERLVGLGCDAGQGYLMSRPVPAAEVRRTLVR